MRKGISLVVQCLRLHFHCRGWSLYPWLGNWSWHGQKGGGGRSKQTFLRRRHTDGQKAHEKMLNITNYWASLVAQIVKNLPAMQETWVQSLGWEDLLKEGMATHSSILAWRIPTNRRAWQATAHGVAMSWTK